MANFKKFLTKWALSPCILYASLGADTCFSWSNPRLSVMLFALFKLQITCFRIPRFLLHSILQKLCLRFSAVLHRAKSIMKCLYLFLKSSLPRNKLWFRFIINIIFFTYPTTTFTFHIKVILKDPKYQLFSFQMWLNYVKVWPEIKNTY